MNIHINTNIPKAILLKQRLWVALGSEAQAFIASPRRGVRCIAAPLRSPFGLPQRRLYWRARAARPPTVPGAQIALTGAGA